MIHFEKTYYKWLKYVRNDDEPHIQMKYAHELITLLKKYKHTVE